MLLISVVCPAVVLYLALPLVRCEDNKEKVVVIGQGPVRGYKENDNFAFYDIPYATAPTGKHRFKAPLPPPSWLTVFEAVQKNIVCPQIANPAIIGSDKIIQEDCLLANVFVPDIDENNIPVVVYVHGGGYRLGYGEFSTSMKWRQMNKFILVTFNYRLGAHGFLCLGTEDVPGNAGMKDQVALLRWVKDNIARFGGNPDDVTIAGYSAGSSSVDLLMLSPLANGLFNKVIPESGSNLGAFLVQDDPIRFAKKFAKLLNFNDVDNMNALEDFYKTASLETLYEDVYSHLVDSPSGFDTFVPCVERKTSREAFLDDSPYQILKSGNYRKVPMLYGFSKMEGLMCGPFFDIWKNNMNVNFTEFLPPNLKFQTFNEKEKIANDIKTFYFNGEVRDDNSLAYIDYFSDIYFTYSTIQSIKLHLSAGHDKIYLYEYAYAYENDPTALIPHTDEYGASHCAQTFALFDGHGLITKKDDGLPEEYLNLKTRMRELWTNFITTGSPVPAGSSLPSWPPTGAGASPYMELGLEMQLQERALLDQRMSLWDGVYEKHYQPPIAPQESSPTNIDL